MPELTPFLGGLGGFFAFVVLVGLIILAILAALMPLYVYRIHNSTKTIVVELHTLNTNLGRFLAMTAPPRAIAPSPQAPGPSLPQTPHVPRPDATVEEKAKFYGVSNKK